MWAVIKIRQKIFWSSSSLDLQNVQSPKMAFSWSQSGNKHSQMESCMDRRCLGIGWAVALAVRSVWPHVQIRGDLQLPQTRETFRAMRGMGLGGGLTSWQVWDVGGVCPELRSLISLSSQPVEARNCARHHSAKSSFSTHFGFGFLLDLISSPAHIAAAPLQPWKWGLKISCPRPCTTCLIRSWKLVT